MNNVLTIQGWYYLLVGIWPLINMDSFEAVAGKKRDRWLVKTVGSLISIIGMSLLLSRRRANAASCVLQAGSAGVLGFIDCWYAVKGTISKVYMLDGIIEAVLVFGAMNAAASGNLKR